MRPGDRIESIGIYRAQGSKVQRQKSQMKAVFNTYADLISFRVLEDNRYKSTLGALATVFSDDEKNKFH